MEPTPPKNAGPALSKTVGLEPGKRAESLGVPCTVGVFDLALGVLHPRGLTCRAPSRNESNETREARHLLHAMEGKHTEDRALG